MDFVKLVYDELERENINWEVKGLIDSNKKIFTLGSDSKLIGRIFELLITVVLESIAEKTEYRLVASESQTVYPDFNLVNDRTGDKIAIDIKTTYRRRGARGNLSNIGFTLGSFASFLRNNTKNIQYPYNEYSKHYVIGFIYDRVESAAEGRIINIDELDETIAPYANVEFFVQEKYRIAGDKPGSGNTENIGSFKTNQSDLIKLGFGPFSFLGNEVFEDYWKNYPKYRESEKKYTCLEEYFDWLDRNRIDTSEIRASYNKWRKQIQQGTNQVIYTNIFEEELMDEANIAEDSKKYS
ncbi:MAG: restriction endonuclease EcoRV [Clostridiales bacterium]|jgi:hypothetical protein|nr:restriction endonuclease EcoRV [Clostridiales bacterium]